MTGRFNTAPIYTSSFPVHTTTATDISPTTVTDPDLATPVSERDSQLSESTRCICNVPDSGGHLMIQWYITPTCCIYPLAYFTSDSCAKWLHVKCVGLNRRNLPPVYVCINCTGQTPAVRGGRVREPMRFNSAMTSSPLARKSQKARNG